MAGVCCGRLSFEVRWARVSAAAFAERAVSPVVRGSPDPVLRLGTNCFQIWPRTGAASKDKAAKSTIQTNCPHLGRIIVILWIRTRYPPSRGGQTNFECRSARGNSCQIGENCIKRPVQRPYEFEASPMQRRDRLAKMGGLMTCCRWPFQGWKSACE